MSPSHPFMSCVAPHIPKLHRIAKGLARDSASADDLVQETLLRAWCHRETLIETQRAGAWLTQILRNAFISRHRHRQVVQRTAERSDICDHLYGSLRCAEAADPEGQISRTQAVRELCIAVQKLPAHYRRVLEAVDLHGYTYRETAELLDIPVGTVMSRLHRARLCLREQSSGGQRAGELHANDATTMMAS